MNGCFEESWGRWAVTEYNPARGTGGPRVVISLLHAQAERFQNDSAAGCHGALTMYKPNFCVECGAQINRRKWPLLTSRRFCDGCAGNFRKAELGLPLILGAAL